MSKRVELYLGDSKEILQKLGDNSVDLIVTSPPYADQRKGTYGGIHPDKYVEWFLPISKELLRVLKPTGTFILNIKEKIVEGERSVYVMELILEMRKQGWLWTEEFIWHKKNCYPGKWPNRFRDAWERLLQFNKNKHFNMYQDQVMVPMGDWAKSRLKNLSETDKVRDPSKVGSGFGKNISNWLTRDKAYPTNVLHLATECSNKNHSAAFPEELPEWFIKLFTKEGDTVLDPFMGSGTSIMVANKMNRKSIGIDLMIDYYNMVNDRLRSSGQSSFDFIVSEPEPIYLTNGKSNGHHNGALTKLNGKNNNHNGVTVSNGKSVDHADGVTGKINGTNKLHRNGALTKSNGKNNHNIVTVKSNEKNVDRRAGGITAKINGTSNGHHNRVAAKKKVKIKSAKKTTRKKSHATTKNRRRRTVR